MRAFNAATKAMLDGGRAVSRTLILFDFPSGLYGFWDGVGTLDYAGVTYVGAGGLLTMGAVALAGNLTSSPLTLSLSSIPQTSLDPDVLASIENEDYHQRPVTLSRAYIDPDSRALLSVERVFRGYVDQIDHELEAGGGAALICKIESRARDATRRGHRTSADADQKRIDPDDGGLRHAATAGTIDLYWGKYPGTVKK